MKKAVKVTVFVAVILGLWSVGSLIKEHQSLTRNLIRLHVVANSDSEFDQTVKMKVKDKVSSYLAESMQQVQTVEDAKTFLFDNLPYLQQLSTATLQEYGCLQTVRVSLNEESFEKRVYDTFSLPAGVYQSLRIEIGEGCGRNWWCVVFPSLCMPATSADFQDTAVSSGFEQDLTATLMEEDGYEIRFFFLDCLGKIQNFFNFQ